MKFSLFQNDRSTIKDELLLLGLIAVFLASGIALYTARPAFWIVPPTFSMGLGVLLILAGLMFVPGLIYRFLTNDKM